MTAFGVVVFVLLMVGLFFLIDWDMDRYAKKQARRRQAGLPYVNVPGAEKDQD